MVTASDTETPKDDPTFDVLPLTPEVRSAVDEMGYVHPTPVQRAVFESAARGKDLVAQARTGTGKTAAFGIPILQRADKGLAAQAIILVPTRELAVQVETEIKRLGQFTQFTACDGHGSPDLKITFRQTVGGILQLADTADETDIPDRYCHNDGCKKKR